MAAARPRCASGRKDIKTFAIPSDKPGVPEPLERILSAVVTPGGADPRGRREEEARSTASTRAYEYRGTFPDKDEKEREITRMFLDGEGGIVCLDREERTVGSYDETGKVLRTVGPAGLKKPVDAAVDAFRNTYVADEEGGVLVFNRDGPAPGHPRRRRRLKRPRALTLDPTGAVLVYDDRPRRCCVSDTRGYARETASSAADCRGPWSLSCLPRAPRPAPLPRSPQTRSSDADAARGPGRPGPARAGGRRSSRARSRAAPSSSSTRSSPGWRACSRQGPLPPRGRDLLAQAYELRGRAYFNIGLQEKASENFRLLVQLKPDYALSKEKVSPKVVDLFNSVKKALVGYARGRRRSRRGPG